jgi:hypothetical protein
LISRLGFAAGLALLLAACADRTPDDPHSRMYVELAGAYEPYSECVQDALQARRDFDGRLAEMAVENGHDGRVQDLHRRYLGTSVDTAAMAPEARVAAARDGIVALGRFGSGGVASPTATPDTVKRMMSVVETMHLISDVAGTSCEFPENLQSWMEKAEHEYL